MAPDGGSPAGTAPVAAALAAAEQPLGEALERRGEELGRALKGALAAARRLRGRETQRAGEVAHAQYALLFELAERGELAAGELAAAAELAPATVTGMLDHLEQVGLVARRAGRATIGRRTK
jgi:DNA-binding MarR family transcriptional regulator